MFVIWNTTQHAYVNRPGQRSSYTKRKAFARRFATREAAERECCGDERVVRLD